VFLLRFNHFLIFFLKNIIAEENLFPLSGFGERINRFRGIIISQTGP
jgi:hypothetical protein